MYYYYTESHFKEYKANLNENQCKFSSIAEKDLNIVFDIFLSYNIVDKAIIYGVYNELTEMGFKVYVDFIIDKDLNRSCVDQKTAKRIRARLENSRSLIYAQSPNAAMSRWMPWELGVVDGHTNKCAVLPILSDMSNLYSKQEYLQIYHIVKPDSNSHMKVFTEENGKETSLSLRSFINR